MSTYIKALPKDLRIELSHFVDWNDSNSEYPLLPRFIYLQALPETLRIELDRYKDWNNLNNDYMRLRWTNFIPHDSRHVLFRQYVWYYKFYFWPTYHIRDIPFYIPIDMTNEELHHRLFCSFHQDEESSVIIHEYRVCPKNRPDIEHVNQYMPVITDISQIRDNELYLVDFH